MNKKWKKYAALLLAGAVSLSAGISTRAALPAAAADNGAARTVIAAGNIQPAAAGNVQSAAGNVQPAAAGNVQSAAGNVQPVAESVGPVASEVGPVASESVGPVAAGNVRLVTAAGNIQPEGAEGSTQPGGTGQDAQTNGAGQDAQADGKAQGTQPDGAGSQSDGAGQGAQPEAGGNPQSGEAGTNPQSGEADGNPQSGEADGNPQSGEAGGNPQPGEAGGTDQDSAKAGGDTDADGENPKVNADINEEPKVSADIVPDDEQDDHVVITEKDKPYLALGANLNQEQKNTVLSLMGIDPASLDQYQVATVTNEEEHQYLDDYLDASIIGTRALSSVVIVKRDKGDGIHISTKNITYCTIGMYKNALATAGLEDADVIIAGPFPLSGTAALIGAMKAYADMEDEEVDTESLDAAMNEIVVTGELNESLGDDVQTEEFIAYVKQKVVEGGLQSKEKIQEVLAEACDKFEISLSDSEKERIISLMEKIGSLDIDVDSLIKQAGSIYDSLKDMESSTGILSRIAAFFKKLLEAVIKFFQELF